MIRLIELPGIRIHLYSLSSGPQINMVKQKKCIATIFEHIILYLLFRSSYEDVRLKKVIIVLKPISTLAFSTSVFHIIYKVHWAFISISPLYKMEKYKPIIFSLGQTLIN